MEQTRRRHRWFGLGARIVRLLVRPAHQTAELVRESYDRAASGYDDAWTRHMRDFSMEMLDRLEPWKGATCLDLACGTGFVTGELMRRTQTRVVGVDSSRGMVEVARERLGGQCTFLCADAIEYLRSCRRNSVDLITCAWGLGYTRPSAVVREAARVLRPRGRMGVIDNTLFSLSGVLWASVLAFVEKPEALVHVMQVRFLPGSWRLALLMRSAGLAVLRAWSGANTYYVPDGRAAIARLTATGAAAGFEFAADDRDREAIFRRFAEILEDRHRRHDAIPITHRYLAAVGQKR